MRTVTPRIWARSGAVVSALLCVAALAATTAADTLHVPGEYGTIQAAINAAMDGDVVEIADSTYTGEGNKDLDFGGRAITVRSASGSPALCIIDCEQDGRGFDFHSGEGPGSVVLGLTITGGQAAEGGGISCTASSPTLLNCAVVDNQGAIRGGGLHCVEGSSPALVSCTLMDNAASEGAGLYAAASAPVLSYCSITGNAAFQEGGGLCCQQEAAPVLVACTISGNSVSNAFGQGAGVSCSQGGRPVLIDCAITGNTGDASGGGVACDASSPRLIRCTLEGNTSNWDGGGVYCIDGSAPAFEACTITGNNAEDGGGVYCDRSDPIFRDCLISENNADPKCGGGLYGTSSSPRLVDCSITGNSASSYGGGIYAFRGAPELTGCTISQNTTLSQGGGAYLYRADAFFRVCSICDNAAQDGGGVHGKENQAVLLDCEIGGNTSTRDGGGVRLFEEAVGILTNCVISGNRAEDGGGVDASYDCHLTLNNCLISDNAATYRGGGIRCATYNSQRSSATLNNCTLSGNSAAAGGGIRCDEENIVGVANSIVWGNTPTAIQGGTDDVTCTFCDVEGGWPGAGNVDADPLFVDPDGADDEPATWRDNDYRLLPGSPCTDAADNTAVPADVFDLDGDWDVAEAMPLDLDGNARFYNDYRTPDTGVPGNGYDDRIVDIGAYECPSPGCVGDLDGDEDTDSSDLGTLLAAYERTDEGDLDGDGDTDQTDLAILLADFGCVPVN